MRFNASVNLIKLDLRGYQKELDSHMRSEVTDAARSWLTTVLTIVPTWSKASRATFEALGNAVGFTITYGPQRSRENRKALGESTGRGGLTVTKTSWHFYYETDLRYLAYNELNQAIPGKAPGLFSRSGLTNPTPYKFQEAGKADFESIAKNVLLPSPMDFIKGERI